MEKHRIRTVQWAEADFIDQILKLMERRRVNRVELARRLGVVPAYVTRLLSGTANLTMETMVRMTEALNASVKIRVHPHPTLNELQNRKGKVWG